MAAVAFECGGQRQRVFAGAATVRADRCDLHLAGADGAGLVEHQISGLRQRVFSETATAQADRCDLHLASAQGAGLVEHQIRDLRERLQRIGAGGEHTDASQVPVSGCQRRGHRQRQRAGTTDDQYTEQHFERTLGRGEVPPRINQHCGEQQGQHEPAGYLVGEAGDTGSMGLGLLHEPRQCRQARGGADAGHAQTHGLI